MQTDIFNIICNLKPGVSVICCQSNVTAGLQAAELYFSGNGETESMLRNVGDLLNMLTEADLSRNVSKLFQVTLITEGEFKLYYASLPNSLLRII